MLKPSYSRQLDTPERKEENGVVYFNHFRKDFIRPYDLAHDEKYDAATLTRRLNNFNCEFYARPQIAISELVETVLENLKYIEENAYILNKISIAVFVSKTKKIEKYLAVVDS